MMGPKPKPKPGSIFGKPVLASERHILRRTPNSELAAKEQ
jgi:hypothetical protein